MTDVDLDRAIERLDDLMCWQGPSPVFGQDAGLCVASGSTVRALAAHGLLAPELLASIGDLVSRFDEGWTISDDAALADVWQSIFVLLADNAV